MRVPGRDIKPAGISGGAPRVRVEWRSSDSSYGRHDDDRILPAQGCLVAAAGRPMRSLAGALRDLCLYAPMPGNCELVW
jgi:hypothetical protein